MTIAPPRLEIILYSIVLILLVLILFLMMNKRKEYFANPTIPNCPDGYDFIKDNNRCSITKKCPDYFTIDSKGNCVLSSCPPNFSFDNKSKICKPQCPDYFTIDSKGNCVLSSCPPNFSFDNKSKICKPISVTPSNVHIRFPNCGSMRGNNTIINSQCCKRKENAAPNSNKTDDYHNCN
jgi:hypothetical protein